MTREEAIKHLSEWLDKKMWRCFGEIDREAIDMAISALSAEKMNIHEVACVLADLFGDTCACNYCDIDSWLPQYCDFANTCCPNTVGVACWEQYLTHKPKVEKYAFEQTEPSDLISREKAIESMELESAKEGAYGYIDIKSAVETLESLPSAEQVTSKLKNPCDSLLTDDSADSKEQKSKLDLISRAEVIKAIKGHDERTSTDTLDDTDIGYSAGLDMAIEIINKVPSVSAVSVEDARSIRNLILVKEYLRGRRDAERGVSGISADIPPKEWEYLVNEAEKLKKSVSAERKTEEFEWCHDCKEYDQEKHYCPRWTKVIRNTVEELKIVRCKDCDNRHTDDCPMYHEEWYEIDEGDGYVDNDFTIHDYSQDDGFCSWAKMKGGAE